MILVLRDVSELIREKIIWVRFWHQNGEIQECLMKNDGFIRFLVFRVMLNKMSEYILGKVRLDRFIDKIIMMMNNEVFSDYILKGVTFSSK